MIQIMQHLAYVDFNTGSLLIQSAIGVVAGVGVFARRSLRTAAAKAGSLFSRRKGQKQKTTEEA